jgi:hypothetical protein
MKRPRKRAPGAGRPPGELGAKRATLSLRLPPHIRVRLVAAAKENRRRSLSEEILIRLNFTFLNDRDEVNRPRHIRALSEEVARIALGVEEETKRPWNEDRYTQQQLSKGIDRFLYKYSRGEAVIPPSVSAEAARNPEDTFFVDGLGIRIADGIITSQKTTPEPPKEVGGLQYPSSYWGPWQIEQDLKPKERK